MELGPIIPLGPMFLDSMVVSAKQPQVALGECMDLSDLVAAVVVAVSLVLLPSLPLEIELTLVEGLSLLIHLPFCQLKKEGPLHFLPPIFPLLRLPLLQTLT